MEIIASRRLIATRDGQVLKEGGGTNKVKKFWTWKGDGAQAERLKGGGEVVEWGERDQWSVEVPRAIVHIQTRNPGKRPKPTTLFRICRHNRTGTINEQGPSVIRRGVCGVQERLLPRPEVIFGTEPDIGEQVLSGAWNP